MKAKFRSLVLIGALGTVLAVILVQRQERVAALREQIAGLRHPAAELTRILGENRRLESARISDAELQALRADHAAVMRLRNEVSAMARRADLLAQSRTGAAPARSSARPTLLDGPLPAAQWTNAGLATPAATVETLLWSAANGDVGRLATILDLPPATRASLESLRATLPANLQAEQPTPELLLAWLTIKNIPLDTAALTAEMPTPDGTVLVLQMQEDRKPAKRVALRLRPDGESWRVFVPPQAVDRYAAALQRPAP